MIQTINQAIHLTRTTDGPLGRAGNALSGLPVGSWGRTVQARDQILDALPCRSLRSYTLERYILAVYEVSDDGRYFPRR